MKKRKESGLIVDFIVVVLVFLVSFFSLWSLRTVKKPTIVKKKVSLIDSILHSPQLTEANISKLQNKIVTLTGKAKTDEILNDSFFLFNKNYLILDRKVEIFAWIEKREGAKTVYEKKWVENVPDSSKFKEAKGHQNKNSRYLTTNQMVKTFKIGFLTFSTDKFKLPHPQRLKLTLNNTNSENKFKLQQNFLTNKNCDLKNPKIGDIRVSFKTIRKDTIMTVFGKLNNKKLIPIKMKNNSLFNQIFFGTKKEAIKEYFKTNQK